MITYNEVNHIDEVIDNISFADEIIVIDSFSTDGTLEKLSMLPHINVLQREFNSFSDQRNFAIDRAKYNWILFIDADERITPELKIEILSKVNENSDIIAYKFPRRFVFHEKIMRYSGLQTDRIYRLFRNGSAHYREDRIVHEILEVNGKSAILKHWMLHYSFKDYDSYKKKIEHYGKLKALELYKKGVKVNWFHFNIRPIFKFVINYIFRLGFLDGKEGYIVCKLNAHGVKCRYRELDRLLRRPPK